MMHENAEDAAMQLAEQQADEKASAQLERVYALSADPGVILQILEDDGNDAISFVAFAVAMYNKQTQWDNTTENIKYAESQLVMRVHEIIGPEVMRMAAD